MFYTVLLIRFLGCIESGMYRIRGCTQLEPLRSHQSAQIVSSELCVVYIMCNIVYCILYSVYCLVYNVYHILENAEVAI